MPASKPSPKTPKAKTCKEKTFEAIFEAVLERMPNRLRWVMARIPFDAAKLWGKRGQIRVQGKINSFAFTATLFPDGRGGHFLLVNNKMLSGGKDCAWTDSEIYSTAGHQSPSGASSHERTAARVRTVKAVDEVLRITESIAAQ